MCKSAKEIWDTLALIYDSPNPIDICFDMKDRAEKEKKDEGEDENRAESEREENKEDRATLMEESLKECKESYAKLKPDEEGKESFIGEGNDEGKKFCNPICVEEIYFNKHKNEKSCEENYEMHDELKFECEHYIPILDEKYSDVHDDIKLDDVVQSEKSYYDFLDEKFYDFLCKLYDVHNGSCCQNKVYNEFVNDSTFCENFDMHGKSYIFTCFKKSCLNMHNNITFYCDSFCEEFDKKHDMNDNIVCGKICNDINEKLVCNMLSDINLNLNILKNQEVILKKNICDSKSKLFIFKNVCLKKKIKVRKKMKLQSPFVKLK